MSDILTLPRFENGIGTSRILAIVGTNKACSYTISVLMPLPISTCLISSKFVRGGKSWLAKANRAVVTRYCTILL